MLKKYIRMVIIRNLILLENFCVWVIRYVVFHWIIWSRISLGVDQFL